MSRHPFPRRLLLATLFLAVPFTARAQIPLEISPYAGMYVPTTSVAELTTEPFGGQSWRHEVAGAFGARVTLWLGARLAAEAAVGYAPGRLVNRIRFSSSAAWLTQSSEHATLWMGTARALWRIVDGTRTSAHLLGGLGLVSRGGDGYAAMDGTTDLVLPIGVGLATRIGDRVGIRWDVEDYISSARPSVSGSESRTQHDLVLSQSVSVRVGGR